MARENFKSRLGFLLVSAGCAIGIGNVWRFPYITGLNGGAIFVLFYLLFLVIMGIPVLSMELAVGRASRKSAVQGYQALEPKGSKWHWHGWVCIIGCYLLMMYYTTVAGWMGSYFVKFVKGDFVGADSTAVTNAWLGLLADPAEMTIAMVIVTVLGFLVVGRGLQGGLEKISSIMMGSLIVLILVLAGNSLLLPGAGEGLAFYLLPDWDRAMQAGIGNVIKDAMNQAFFTLSLGIAAMEIFGSYMSKKNTLVSESVRICALDTFVAFSSGLIIFPACFSFGVTPDQGPGLIFVTLPNVFANMPGGRLWGALFFLFMTFASFTTVIAVFENLLGCCMDNFGWGRKKAVWINCVFVLLASVPCVLGFNVWKTFTIAGMDVQTFEDFVVSNLLLPGGSLIYLLFCTTKWGWNFDNYLAECNTGEGIKLSPAFKPFFRFVLPVIILIILVLGLI